VRFTRRAKAFDRTCADCGYTWRVPRAFARLRLKSISAFDIAGGARGMAAGRAELNRQVQSSMSRNEQAEAFRCCPECGSAHYSQRPAED
jgi:hypothetical protein